MTLSAIAITLLIVLLGCLIFAYVPNKVYAALVILLVVFILLIAQKGGISL